MTMSHQSKPTIVLVEDNKADVYLLRQALAEHDVDAELTIYEDGEAAHLFFRADVPADVRVPDLVVLDLNIPRFNGLEVLHTLRENPAYAKVPVVVFTSSDSPSDRASAEREGADHYLRKPPDLDAFLGIGGFLRKVLAGEDPAA